MDSKPLMGRKVDFDLRILPAVYQDLVDYLKMPIEEISRDYWRLKETEDKKQQQQVENATCEEEVNKYYRTTRQYLYELSCWEAQKDKQREFKKIYLFCRKFNIRKVLDFGGGIGGLSIYLNNHGLECDYLDLPGHTYNYAKWRFDRHKINLRLINSSEGLSSSSYDAVIVFDVFEHMFDLPRIIKEINSCLVNGGYLLGISTFSGGSLHLVKNKIYQNFKNFNEFLAQNGFEFIGQLKADRLSGLLNKVGFKYLLFSIGLRKRQKHGGNLIVHRKIADRIDIK